MQSDYVRLAGLYEFGLLEVAENFIRFLYASLGVGRGVVELNYVFTRIATGVGYFDLYGYLARSGERNFGGSGLPGEDLPIESGVGEAVSERIHNRVPIPFFAVCVRYFPYSRYGLSGIVFVRSRFVISVTEVDALFVVLTVATGVRSTYAVLEACGALYVCVGAPVEPGGILGEIDYVRIGKMRRRVSLTGYESAECVITVVTYAAYPYSAFDVGISGVLQLVESQSVGSVYNENYVLVVVVSYFEELFFLLHYKNNVLGFRLKVSFRSYINYF